MYNAPSLRLSLLVCLLGGLITPVQSFSLSEQWERMHPVSRGAAVTGSLAGLTWLGMKAYDILRTKNPDEPPRTTWNRVRAAIGSIAAAAGGVWALNDLVIQKRWGSKSDTPASDPDTLTTPRSEEHTSELPVTL